MGWHSGDHSGGEPLSGRCAAPPTALAFAPVARSDWSHAAGVARSTRGLLPAALSTSLLIGCVAQGSEPLRPINDGDTDGPRLVEIEPSQSDPSDLPPLDPHTVLGVEPPHGPFSGGRTVLIRGNGFDSQVRVWFGDAMVQASDTTSIDARRIQVVTPPGHAGMVDVTVQNGSDESTRRSLQQAYEYDRFEVHPGQGPTSGGTQLAIRGQETSWTSESVVMLGSEPCPDVKYASPTEIACVTPPGPLGTLPVKVLTEGQEDEVLDAFAYVDSNDGYRGGATGEPLAEELQVLVLDAYTGSTLEGAHVVLDTDVAGALVTNDRGQARFRATDLGPQRTVTVAMPCYQPQTFAAVAVDTLTIYLDPVLSPGCGEGNELPAVGGTGSAEHASIDGELVWRSGLEFRREGWTNVPPARYAGDHRVAYVLRATSRASTQFQLPAADEAVTFDSDGEIGFGFAIDLAPGTYTLYALAGIENRDRTPPTFTAYSMGIARGVTARLDDSPPEVYIRVDVPLDHSLTLDVEGPTPTSRGPDRVISQVSIRLADGEYSPLPGGQKSSWLPITDPVDFVGVPPLSGQLAGASYLISARAVTGAGASDPSSRLGLFSATSTSSPVDISGFIEVPQLVEPASGEVWSGASLTIARVPGGRAPNLSVIEIQSGDGLVNWKVVLPGDEDHADLPDLGLLGNDLGFGLLPGAITFVVSAAAVEDFSYDNLRYGDLSPSGWDAYARDTFHARH